MINSSISRQKIYFYLIIVLISSIFYSCGSKKILYNPDEVSYLSRQLRIPIENDDPDIPLFAEVSLWLGVPYKYGGNTKKGTDCSGFVSTVFHRLYGKKLERSSHDQAKNNVSNIKKKELKAGDLVFFKTLKNSKKIDHVGIFLKDGYFIHASTSRGVIVSSLNEEYYRRSWQKGGRVR